MFTFTREMPFSEVCMHMHIAGQPMKVRLLPRRMVQLYTLDGQQFSSPITHGEAGIYDEEWADLLAEQVRVEALQIAEEYEAGEAQRDQDEFAHGLGEIGC